MDPAVTLWSAQELSESFHHLPPTAHLLAVGGVVVGVVLWVAGEQILRMVFAALGGIAGAGAGFFLLPVLAPTTIAGYPSPHVGLVAGSFIGLLLAILFYRFAVAVLLALGLSVAAVLVAAAAVHFQPVPDSQALRSDYAQFAAPLQSPMPEEAGAEENPTPEAEEPAEAPPERDRLQNVMDSVRPVADRVRIFLRARADEFGETWADLDARHQAIILSSSIAGLATGFVLGLFFPGRSAAAATSMAGAAVWMPCMLWLWQTMEAPGAQRLLMLQAGLWLFAWAALAILGFGIQSSRTIRWRGRKA